MNTNNEQLVAQYDHYYIFRILVIVMTRNQLKNHSIVIGQIISKKKSLSALLLNG